MGPGFFPLTDRRRRSAVLALAIAVRAFGRQGEALTFAGPRALACILLAPAAFALAVGPLGFVPAIALTVLRLRLGQPADDGRSTPPC